MIVEIAEPMKAENGKLNTPFFKDTKFLKSKEKEALIDFIYKVAGDHELSGKNKPSWQDDFGNELSGAEEYKKLNCWHYHSGPSYHKKKYPVAMKKLEFNPNGDTSLEVIHYQKIDGNTIFIQVFSPKHEPFPTVHTTPNPILDRIFEQKFAELGQILSDIDKTN